MGWFIVLNAFDVVLQTISFHSKLISVTTAVKQFGKFRPMAMIFLFEQSLLLLKITTEVYFHKFFLLNILLRFLLVLIL